MTWRFPTLFVAPHAMADAVLLAADLLVSQPSLTGTTAIDRLARRLGKLSGMDGAAMAALSRHCQVDASAARS
ncbi:MAG TPA: hypothetical protein PK677_16090 [Acidiphilium sp.]|nr:hypothetical protein [Acidiphilium sp.]